MPYKVIETLGRIGSGAKDALPILKEQLLHKQKGPRKAAAAAIDRITGNREAPRKQGTDSGLGPRSAVDLKVGSKTNQPDRATTNPNPPPSEYSKAETITVKGVVLDPEKRPLANVDVRIYETFTRSEKLFGKVRSGKDGGFRFVGIPKWRGRAYYKLTASSPNFATRLLSSAPASKESMFEYEVVLFERESLRGRVVGPDGKPVAGADVYTPSFNNSVPGLHSAKTDTNGYFEIRDLMPWDSANRSGGGSKALRVYHPEFGKILASYKRVPSTVSVKFSRPTIITGRVIDRETGKPATEVSVIGGYILTKTDQDGRYRLVVQPRTRERDIIIKSIKNNGEDGQSISLTAIPGARIELPDFRLSQ